ncbi:hypothetical protein [Vulcanisaeta sp. JCM 16161]|nr:hypothetical protein [Vulcanisaeta sp. JCM 16161]
MDGLRFNRQFTIVSTWWRRDGYRLQFPGSVVWSGTFTIPTSIDGAPPH